MINTKKIGNVVLDLPYALVSLSFNLDLLKAEEEAQFIWLNFSKPYYICIGCNCKSSIPGAVKRKMNFQLILQSAYLLFYFYFSCLYNYFSTLGKKIIICDIIISCLIFG